MGSHKLLVIGTHDLKCNNLNICFDTSHCLHEISTSFLKLVRSFSCDFFCFERCWMKSMDFCSTTALLTLCPEASVWKETEVNHRRANSLKAGRDLSACWHKLLKSVVTLLDGIATLLLCSSVRLPSPLPVRLAVLRVAVAVVVCAWLCLSDTSVKNSSLCLLS